MSENIYIDPNNTRIHDNNSKDAIAKSIELGFGRSILIDSENNIVGGNGVFQEAEKRKSKIRIIETDGSELIAVKRIDLKTNDPLRKAMAIADNRVAELSKFDPIKLAALFSDLQGLQDNTGFSQAEINAMCPPDEEINDQFFNDQDKPEIRFSEELLESHNYVVLFFDNQLDWLQAQTIFDIKTVKNMTCGTTKNGIGRVINGAKAINKILDAQKKNEQPSTLEA